jgi:hypothetical protein
MSLLRTLITPLALVVAAAALPGCNFILNPEHSDDILRCGNAIDCEAFPEIADAVSSNRVQANCNAPSSDAGVDISKANENQVCSVVDKEVSCAMASYGGTEDAGNSESDNPYVMAFTTAVSRIGLYVACDVANLGVRGCKPMNGACGSGLAVNRFGVCDDPNADLLAYEANVELKGQDVRDQFCRSFFCSEEFACAASDDGKTYLCRRCDDKKAIGEGGCGDLYFNGVRSTVYTESECPASSEAKKTSFGEVPPSPMP